ncbi:hypothetical protein [Flexivirga caeni]|uniref:hypothetical protein n=1 Tax=Flexivirga caeni TaxID=2294115 RepID=UPI001315585E|nr:hypothetical protein [Flexivirga caeni]
MGPNYSASSIVTLIPPDSTVTSQQKSGAQYAPANPLLYLGSLTQARDVLVGALGSSEVSQAVQKAAPSAQFEAAADAVSSAPLIDITVTAKSSTQALAGLKAADAQVPGTLTAVQGNLSVEASSRITSMVISADDKAKPVKKKAIQDAGIGGVGILVVLLIVIAIVDSATHRTSRSGQSDSSDAASDTQP